MRDDGGGALSAITVSSRELAVRGAAGAGLYHGRAAAQLQRAGLLAHELLGLLHLCVCLCLNGTKRQNAILRAEGTLARPEAPASPMPDRERVDAAASRRVGRPAAAPHTAALLRLQGCTTSCARMPAVQWSFTPHSSIQAPPCETATSTVARAPGCTPIVAT